MASKTTHRISLSDVLLYALTGLAVAALYFAFQHRDRLFADSEPVSDIASGSSIQGSLSDAVARVSPAVVNVYVDKIVEQRPVSILRDPNLRRFAGRAVFGTPGYSPRNELGSGVIVGSEGYILTNFHVIRGADGIRVELLDGSILDASIVGYDEETDLALLKVDGSNMPTAPMADMEKLRVGDMVLAIGNPFGLGNSVTMGIVSATGRADLKVSLYEDFIQTDAAINQGNSGGALVNISGEIVGISTALLEHQNGAEGIGFAIPIDLAMDVMNQIRTAGRVERGWAGVELADPRRLPGIAEQAGTLQGLVITGVYPESPADLAGLRPGDFITGYEGAATGNLRAMLKRIADSSPGSTVEISYLRNRTERVARVELIQRPPRLPRSG